MVVVRRSTGGGTTTPTPGQWRSGRRRVRPRSAMTTAPEHETETETESDDDGMMTGVSVHSTPSLDELEFEDDFGDEHGVERQSRPEDFVRSRGRRRGGPLLPLTRQDSRDYDEMEDILLDESDGRERRRRTTPNEKRRSSCHSSGATYDRSRRRRRSSILPLVQQDVVLTNVPSAKAERGKENKVVVEGIVPQLKARSCDESSSTTAYSDCADRDVDDDGSLGMDDLWDRFVEQEGTAQAEAEAKAAAAAARKPAGGNAVALPPSSSSPAAAASAAALASRRPTRRIAATLSLSLLLGAPFILSLGGGPSPSQTISALPALLGAYATVLDNEIRFAAYRIASVQTRDLPEIRYDLRRERQKEWLVESERRGLLSAGAQGRSVEEVEGRAAAIRDRVGRLRREAGFVTRERVLDRFGSGPHYVRFDLDFGDDQETEHGDERQDSSSSSFVVKMASLSHMPHSVGTFLEQVHSGFWTGRHFNLNAGHILLASGPTSPTTDDAVSRSLRDAGLATPAFPEYSPLHPHAPYTLGFVAHRSSPHFYVNTKDNTDVHGPASGQTHHEEHDGGDDADPCFGTIVGGFDAVRRLQVAAPNPLDEASVKMAGGDGVRIVKATVLPSGGPPPRLAPGSLR